MFKKLSYFLFILSTTNRIFPYLLILGTTALVILVGMNAYFFGLFSSDALEAEGIDNIFGGGFFDTLWWSMKHLLDPGALSENYGAPLPVLVFALFNSVMGLIITGALIGFIVSAIQTTVDNAKVGAATIQDSGHYLLLGWNRKGPAILELFARLNVLKRIVILTEHNLEQLRVDLRQNYRTLRNLKILPVQGAIGSSSELRRVAASRASHVLVLAESKSAGQSDMTSIRALTILTAIGGRNETNANLVAEIVNKSNVEIAKVATRATHPIVSSSDFISKTMAQCARYPGYSMVYSELFASGDFVIDLFPVPLEMEGILFSQISDALANVATLGISWVVEKDGQKRRASVLNPEPDYDLAEGDELIVLRHQDEKPQLMSAPSASNLKEKRTIAINMPDLSKVLIITANQNLNLMVEELMNHAASNLEIVVACQNSVEEENLFWQKSSTDRVDRLSLTFVEFDLVESSNLEGIAPQDFDVVFITADESQETIDADSRTMLILFLLQELRSRNKDAIFPPVVVELLNSESRELCEATPMTDAVISTEILSTQLAQLVRDPYLETLYNELLNAGGIEIGIREAVHFTGDETKISWESICQRGHEFHEVVLGYLRQGKIFVCPNKRSIVELDNKDSVIVLAQQVYR